jgi:DNA-directed RNA polymerase sigma subunit (sigma70/sigma32)
MVAAIVTPALLWPAAGAQQAHHPPRVERLINQAERLAFVLRTVQNSRALSLDQPLGEGDADGSLLDRVGDGREAHEPRSYDWLHLEVAKLSSLERQILDLRYASEPGLTLKMASEQIGIPRDRLKRIERRALDKLRQRVAPMLHPA